MFKIWEWPKKCVEWAKSSKFGQSGVAKKEGGVAKEFQIWTKWSGQKKGGVGNS